MQLSPLDVRKQTFKRTLRGVDPEEVRMFLELVASEFEKVVQDNAMMAEKLNYQDERLDEYRDLEKSLRNSLVTAERIASESREASDREAERIKEDAHARAERILEDSRERLQRLVQDIETLQSKKDLYVRRFRAMLEGQLSVLGEHEEQFGDIDAIEQKAQSLLTRSSTRAAAAVATSDAAWAPPVERVEGRFESIAVREDRGAEALPYEPENQFGHGIDGPGSYEADSYESMPSGEVASGPEYAATDEAASEYGTADDRTPGSERNAPYPGDGGAEGNQEELPFGEQEEPYDPVHVAAGTGEAGFFEIQSRSEGFFEFDPSEDPDKGPSS